MEGTDASLSFYGGGTLSTLPSQHTGLRILSSFSFSFNATVSTMRCPAERTSGLLTAERTSGLLTVRCVYFIHRVALTFEDYCFEEEALKKKFKVLF